MAERVDAMPDAGGGARKYPWDEWLDGSVWELIRGKDFEVETHTMTNTAKAAARTRHVAVTVAVRGDRVYVQAKR